MHSEDAQEIDRTISETLWNRQTKPLHFKDGRTDRDHAQRSGGWELQDWVERGGLKICPW